MERAIETAIGRYLYERLTRIAAMVGISRCLEKADTQDAPILAEVLLDAYADFVLDGGTEYVSNGE